MNIHGDTRQTVMEPGAKFETVASLDGFQSAVIENMPIGLVLSDDDGVVSYVNAESARIFGLTRNDLAGQRIGELLPRALAEPTASNDCQVDCQVDWQVGAPRTAGATREMRLLRPNGADVWVEVASRHLSNGPRSQVLTTISDISERRDIDLALKKITFDQAPYGLLLVDGDGSIVSSNELLNRIFGYEAAELLGKKVEMLVPARFRDAHFAQKSLSPLRHRRVPWARNAI